VFAVDDKTQHVHPPHDPRKRFHACLLRFAARFDNSLALDIVKADPRAKLPGSHRTMRNSGDDSIHRFKDVVHLGLEF